MNHIKGSFTFNVKYILSAYNNYVQSNYNVPIMIIKRKIDFLSNMHYIRKKSCHNKRKNDASGLKLWEVV